MDKYSSLYLALKKETLSTLFEDISQRPNIEACGVLLGEIDADGNWHVDRTYPLQNTAASPVYFEFAPDELLQTELLYPDQIIGVYHSHPTGFPMASATDCENMQRVNQDQHIPWAWIIIKGPFDEASLHAMNGEVSPTSLIAYHHFENNGLNIIPIAIQTS
ncbi:Mov34/MPN/PAD-1 family protein [Dictyobacter formicarum]|uniref:MPN domain-containing protein n=1 Tax=Dictyobacter formicarum TaxID=2778368 RepID=A0ABQ3VA07_9CHLR|nr:Mov34/MPN/PAD-1 family protein [Dictyobacter formicarum]GHO82829.1 hypothetical protein KSZ_08350 [Dictyobacter formicarum]